MIFFIIGCFVGAALTVLIMSMLYKGSEEDKP